MNSHDPDKQEPPVNKSTEFEKFCSACGEKMEPVKEVCSKCGKQMGMMMSRCIDCCEKSDMMRRCLEKGGWALMIPYTLGVILFLVGWFLSAEAVRALWLMLSGVIAFIGFVGLIFVNLMIRKDPKA